MKINEIISNIEDFAPLDLAYSWDNVGLLSGDLDHDTDKGLICLDINEDVYRKCVDIGANLCISHHPFIFEPVYRLDCKDPYHELLKKFIKSDIAIYAAHTNLDACIGGVSDTLSESVGLKPIGTILPAQEDMDKKVVVPGLGRYCSTKSESNRFGIYKNILKNLHIKGCPVNFDKDASVKKVAVVPGSYDSQLNEKILENRVDAVLSGEIKHKDMVFFQRYNIAAIAAGHDATERTVLKPLSNILTGKMPHVSFDVFVNIDYNFI